MRRPIIAPHLSTYLFLVTVDPEKTTETGSSLKEWTLGPVKSSDSELWHLLCAWNRILIFLPGAWVIATELTALSAAANAIISVMKNFWPDRADVLLNLSHSCAPMGFLFVMMADDIDIFAHCSVVLLFWFWIVNLCTVKTVNICVYRWCIKWWSISVSISIHVSEVCTGLPSNKWSFFPWQIWLAVHVWRSEYFYLARGSGLFFRCNGIS